MRVGQTGRVTSDLRTDGAADWSAPRAHEPVDAVVELPGSKSMTNRMLVLASLADGPSRISRPLRARDTELMVAALRTLGASITDSAPGTGDAAGGDWVVTPGRSSHGGDIHTGLAGTVMRFVPPAAALVAGDIRFDGDEYARERPMATLLDGLRQAGVTIDDGGTGRMPFTVRGTGSVAGGRVQLDASGSSQFVSGLLLAAARFDKGIEIVHSGARGVPSLPHIDMTLATLADSGVDAARTSDTSWQVAPGPIRARDVVIEPDLSNAAPFLAAALVTGGTVRIPGWPTATTQPGDALRELLSQMGAEVSSEHDGALVVRGSGTIHGLTADLRDVTELATILAVLAALADGPSHLSGLAHTRLHETDRLAALSTEINGLGGDVVEDPDGLTIIPRPLHGGRWRTYADHRMATAGAVLGLAVDGIEIENIATTGKTLPDFVGLWNQLLESDARR